MTYFKFEFKGVIKMEEYEITDRVIHFCSLKDKETRYEEIKKPIYLDKRVIQILNELVKEEQNLESCQNYVDHIELFKEYQLKGRVALDYFVSILEIRSSFIKFAYGFNNFEDRKKFLLSNPFLIDRKSIGYIIELIDREKYLSQRIASRLYRNLLKACRVIGIEKAFEEFDTPEDKYVDAVNCLLEKRSIYEILLFMNDYKEEISSKKIRNVFQYLQAEFEKETLKKGRIIAVWDIISKYQEEKRTIWFWE
jgi:hypothetical protein